jgi:hypothetical protein
MIPIPRLTPEREQQFWSRVRRTPDECWDWQGSGTGIGYGVFSVGGRQVNSHRVAASLTLEDFSPEKFVLHRCDNPRCVRPSHLFTGTQKENFEDAVAKGRAFFKSERQREHVRLFSGELNPNAKLTLEMANEIRRRYAAGGVTQAALGVEFGVRQTTISTIVRGKKWRES